MSSPQAAQPGSPTSAPAPGTTTAAPLARPALKPAAPPLARTAPPAEASQPLAAASSEAIWKRLFETWPEAIPRRGIVITPLNDPLPFKAFMTRDDVVLLERTNPDTLGARFLVVPYTEVSLVKLTEPLKQEVFEQAGFVGSLSF